MTLFSVALADAFSDSAVRCEDSQPAQVEGSQRVWLPATPNRQVLHGAVTHGFAVVPVPPVAVEVRARKLRVHEAWGVSWGRSGERAWTTRPSAAAALARAWMLSLIH